MLNIDNPAIGPVTLRLSFWQCVKAGVAFSLGATAVIPAIMIVSLIVYKFALLFLVLRLL